MGNAHVKPHPRNRNKKQVHWRAAALPQAPGKPYLASDAENTADLVTIRWSKPVNDGGSPIQGYLVEHRRQGSPHWVRASPLLVQLPELTVSGLEPGWRYQFRVRAENAVGISDPSEVSEPITVTLQRSAITAPRFTQELHDATALENEKVEFTVNFLGQPPPKVCWFKDAFEIFSSRRIRIITDSDRSILTIHQCSLSDEGEIKCTATNRAGHVSTKAKLTVEAPPSIRLPRQYEDGLLFEIGEQIRLKVSVAGRPTPLVFWSHDGESINNSDRYEIESSNTYSVLKIHEARREDRGEYQIRAVNKISNDIQSFLVTVTDKPSPPGKARVVMALGRSVTLSWVPPRDDGGCKIGNYIVEYYRVGWNVWLKAATSRQLTTMLGDLIEGSEYKFRVKAESPYGVSEPSEETETVFIPDAKRGILQPPSRGRSQPREVIESSLNTTPVASRRKKPRSQSSSRAEDEQKTVHFDGSAPPVRPDRSKIKSPPKTPEMSPLANRKAVDTIINKQFFEQSGRSMARELAYGSPEIKVRKETYLNNSSSSDRSRTPSPSSVNQSTNHKRYTVKIERSPERQTKQAPIATPTVRNKSASPEPVAVNRSRSPNDEVTKKRPSPEPQKKSLTPSPKANRKLPRENSENFTGSSEFMLVLYPGLNEIGQSDFDFNDNLVPPPMSLSAPELGSEEPPQFNILRSSSSSSELLHERAMMRLYEAAEAEENELERRRRAGEGRAISVPKILINSKDDEDIVGLERHNSIKRRMSAGGISHQQALWAQRRISLKSPSELRNELLQQRSLSKVSATADGKRALMMDRQRSESEEKEEKALEDVRRRMQNQPSLEKRKIEVVEEENWADDYTSSTESDSEISESEDERLLRATMNVSKRQSYDSEEEREPYHPGGLAMRTLSDDKPFEILTKRKEPPSPDFVPKPILKKPDKNMVTPIAATSPPPSPTRRAGSPIPTMSPPMSPTRRAGSPIPARSPPTSPTRRLMSPIRSMSPPSSPNNNTTKREFSPAANNNFNRSRSHSLAATPEDFESVRKFNTENIPQRQRSASLAFQEEYLSMKSEFPNSPPTSTVPDTSKPAYLMNTISAVAQISGITAASVIIPGQLLDKKKDEEEAKVVIDHYGDIVKNYGNKKRNNPPIYLDRDSLKNAAESSKNRSFAEDTETEKEEPVPPEMNRFTDHYTSPRRDSLTAPKATVASSHTKTFSPTRQRSPSPKRISSASPGRHKPQLAMSPVRVENWSPPNHQVEGNIKRDPPRGRQRKTSPSPIRTENGRNTARSPLRTTEPKKKTSPSPMRVQGKRKTSPSPLRQAVTGVSTETRKYSGYRPLLKEIMTQTSEGLNSFDSEAYSRTSSPTYQDELLERAKVTVRSTVDYITDLAMFVVACWLYLFKNELLAIPVLLVLAYRQLQAEISKRIPNWLLRLAARFQRKKTS